jgi:hypothetical protein
MVYFSSYCRADAWARPTWVLCPTTGQIYMEAKGIYGGGPGGGHARAAPAKRDNDIDLDHSGSSTGTLELDANHAVGLAEGFKVSYLLGTERSGVPMSHVQRQFTQITDMMLFSLEWV